MKNKKFIHILILQICCVVLTITLLLFMKHFYKNTFLKIKEKHSVFFEEETVIADVFNEDTKTLITMRANSLCPPVNDGIITSGFGGREDPFTKNEVTHYGIDIAAKESKEILAVASGKVVNVGYDKDGYGNFIKINHNENFTTLYGHCEKVNVKRGDLVEKGQPIGKVGNTGRSTSEHLHFEVLIKNVPQNATWFINF